MTAISTWSTTAASNDTAPPDGAPEGMKPSDVNDTIRENMAQVRSWYDTMEWRDFGHTITYVSGTSFKTSGVDTTSVYTVTRRVHANGSATGDIHGTVVSSTFSTDTTVVVVWDAGASLSNEALTIEVGLDPTNTPIAGAGGWEVLTANSAIGAVTEIEVTTVAGYDYRVEFFALQPDVVDAFGIQLYEGAAYKTTSGDYLCSWQRTDTTPLFNSINDRAETLIRIGNTDTTNSAPALDDRAHGWVELRQMDSTTLRTNWDTRIFAYDDGDSVNLYREMSGYRAAIAAVTKFKMMWSAGSSFDSNGRYIIYRRRNGN